MTRFRTNKNGKRHPITPKKRINPNIPSQHYVNMLIDTSRENAIRKSKYMLEYKPKDEKTWRIVSVGFKNKDDAELYFKSIRDDFKNVFKKPVPEHRVVPIDISKRPGSWSVAERNSKGKLVVYS